MRRRLALPALLTVLALVAAACSGGGDDGDASPAADTSSTTAERVTTTTAETPADPATGTCDSVTPTYRAVTSANADLPNPVLTVTCDDGVVHVETNAIPDYPYVQTTPGELEARDATFEIPVTPTDAEIPGEIPRVGPSAVAIDGVPIFGPTEATGGDVLSLQGALSDCGSHNGPPGFHMHLFGWADGVQCLYTADDVDSGPQLVGWSLDGYPVMSGVACTDDDCTTTEQLESSWQLTDESLFATDTWSAHSYVEGSGDLDECNGRVDDDGQYRYYTTTTFPYFMGCYRGELLDTSGAGGAGLGGPPGA
jgi:YHYH protein